MSKLPAGGNLYDMIIAHQTHLAIRVGRCTWSPGSRGSECMQRCWHTGWARTAPRHKWVRCRVARTDRWNSPRRPHRFRDSDRGWTHTRLCFPDTDYLWRISTREVVIKFTSTCSSPNCPAGGDIAQLFSAVTSRHFNPSALIGFTRDPRGLLYSQSRLSEFRD